MILSTEKYAYYKELLTSYAIVKIEKAVIFLKEHGADQMQSAGVIMRVFNLSLSEADKYILYADCWKENLNFNIELRNKFFSEE